MSKKKIIIKMFLTVFCCFFLAALSNAESCSTAGQTQNKYTASGCSYTTQTRTCCATTGAWSDWGASCPSCSSSQCWNGSQCVDKPSDCNIETNTGCYTYKKDCSCSQGLGWQTANIITRCNGPFTIKNNKCISVADKYICRQMASYPGATGPLCTGYSNFSCGGVNYILQSKNSDITDFNGCVINGSPNNTIYGCSEGFSI